MVVEGVAVGRVGSGVAVELAGLVSGEQTIGIAADGVTREERMNELFATS